jgi:hypothetical protein
MALDSSTVIAGSTLTALASHLGSSQKDPTVPQFFGILALLHVAFLSVLLHRNHDGGILGLIKLLLLFYLWYFVVLGTSITIYRLSSTCKSTRGPILGKLGELHLSHICGLEEVIDILRLFARNTETLYDMVQKSSHPSTLKI